MAFRMFLVFLAFTMVIHFSGNCSAQNFICTLVPCPPGKADDSAHVGNRDFDLANFRRSGNRIKVADILRNYEKKNLNEPVDEEE